MSEKEREKWNNEHITLKYLGTWVVKDVLLAGPFPLKACIVTGLPVIYQKLITTFKDIFLTFRMRVKRKYITD